jgi:hypothetical protein
MEILLISVSVLMFLEGAAFSAVIGLATKQSKWALPFLALLWPVALPALGIKTYIKYAPLLIQLRNNPMFSMMLGNVGPGLPQQTQQTPDLGALFKAQAGPSELERLIKEAQEASASEEEDDETKGE